MCLSVHVHGVCVCKGGEHHWGHAWLVRYLATFGHGLDRKAIIKEQGWRDLRLLRLWHPWVPWPLPTALDPVA